MAIPQTLRGWTFVKNPGTPTEAIVGAGTQTAVPFERLHVQEAGATGLLKSVVATLNRFVDRVASATLGSRSIPFGAGGTVLRECAFTAGKPLTVPHRLGTPNVNVLGWARSGYSTKGTFAVSPDGNSVVLTPTVSFVEDVFITVDTNAPNFKAIAAIAPGPTGTVGGDLSGTLPDPEVVGLLSNPLPALASGFLKWTGSALAWVNGGLNSYGPYASRPSPGTAGRIYYCSDASIAYLDTGSTWLPIVGGQSAPSPFAGEATPGNVIGRFTQVGYAAPDSIGFAGGYFSFVKGTHGGTNSILGCEEPKTAGQTFTVHLIFGVNGPTAGNQMGVWVRDSVSGKLETLMVTQNTSNVMQLDVQTMTSLAYGGAATSVSQSIQLLQHGIWLQIQDDGADLHFRWGFDGVFWNQFYTDTGPYVPSRGNLWGFGVNPANATTQITPDSISP